jgi:hypothetical protein
MSLSLSCGSETNSSYSFSDATIIPKQEDSPVADLNHAGTFLGLMTGGKLVLSLMITSSLKPLRAFEEEDRFSHKNISC